MGDHFDWQPNSFEPVAIDLIPISYRVEKGSRIQISLAAKDDDHFDDPDPKGHTAEKVFVKISTEHPSMLSLPVVSE